MKEMLDPFHAQYDAFIRELFEKSVLRFGTLGPDGTSSQQALCFLTKQIQTYKNNIDIKHNLQQHFDLVFDDLDHDRIDYAIVPAAYHRITDFFWHDRFVNNLNFIFATPEYGIVSRINYELDPRKRTSIATCPAVENIIDQLSDGILGTHNTIKVITSSTTEAILELVANRVELAITNQTSFDLHKGHGLRFLFRKRHAQIVWSLFKKRQPLSSEHPQGYVHI